MTADLERITRDIGRHGFRSILMGWYSPREPQIIWQRTGFMDIAFKIPDYLADCPTATLMDDLDRILRRIHGEDIPQSPDMVRYVYSNEYCERYQPIYLQRHDLTPYKIAQGVAFVESTRTAQPSRTLNMAHRVVLIRPEWAEDENIEHIAIQGVYNQIARYIRMAIPGE